jgi:hypothetical protein
MNQKSEKTVLLVDYENVQNFDLSTVCSRKNVLVKIFVGQSQNKIPFDLVQIAQQMGKRVEWIKMDGSGSNALDFHIAFYLGVLSSNAAEKNDFLILSKDKGFDPLIQHINKQSQTNCNRIESLTDLAACFISADSSAVDLQEINPIEKILCNLSKIQKNKRPRTRKTLLQHIKSLLSPRKPRDEDVEQLIDDLFAQRKITEANSRLTYNF